MLVKLTAKSVVLSAGACNDACSRTGRAKARTFSSESTRADRLKDLRNPRREENKRLVPSRSARARIRPLLYSEKRLDIASVTADELSLDRADEWTSTHLIASASPPFVFCWYLLLPHQS